MQAFLVALIVLAAAAYSVWRLGPAVLRRRLSRAVASAAVRSGASAPVAHRIALHISPPKGGGCSSGGCGPCKGCGP